MKKLIKREEGQGMTEYAVILTGIAVLIIIAIYVIGDQVTLLYKSVITA